MTEIKTAQAWGALSWTNGAKLATFAQPHQWSSAGFPVVIVHGLTEAGVHEAAALRSACRELGVETVEQLKTRLAPDPRVAVLDRCGIINEVQAWQAVAAIRYASDNLGHGYDGRALLAKIGNDYMIAAQRGEGG